MVTVEYTATCASSPVKKLSESMNAGGYEVAAGADALGEIEKENEKLDKAVYSKLNQGWWIRRKSWRSIERSRWFKKESKRKETWSNEKSRKKRKKRQKEKRWW